jgi:hypothetical protein
MHSLYKIEEFIYIYKYLNSNMVGASDLSTATAEELCFKHEQFEREWLYIIDLRETINDELYYLSDRSDSDERIRVLEADLEHNIARGNELKQKCREIELELERLHEMIHGEPSHYLDDDIVQL